MTWQPCAVRPWLCGAAGLVLGVAPSLAAGWDFQIAPGAWSLEQFGTDVAVLRSAPLPARSSDVSLLFSCSADDRRIRIAFPTALTAGAANGGHAGSALFSALGPTRIAGGAVVRFKVSDPGTLVVGTSTAGPDDPVTDVATMLAAGTRSLDLLVSWGAAPVVLTSLDVYRLSLRGAAPDKDVVAHFIAACRHTMPQRDH